MREEPYKPMKKILGMFVALASLSACDQDIEPIDVTIKAAAPFDLVAVSGSRVAFAPEADETGVASYDERKKRLILAVGTEKIVFQNARVDRDTARIISSPNNSGQVTSQGERVGAYVSRATACLSQPCIRQRSHVEWRSCQYGGPGYGPGSGCYYDAWGRLICPGPGYPGPGYQGRQQVEVIETSRDYELTAAVRGQTRGPLATAKGYYTEISYSERIVSGCF